MKNQYLIITLLVSLLTSTHLFSQTEKSPYEVAIWSGFRTAAINYTFDDGCPKQYKVAIPLFDKYDFKLTLFTVSSWVTDWSVLDSAAANGHEIASHSATHPNFGSITATQLEQELRDSKDSIEKHIPFRKCLTIAYPYCAPGIDTVCSKYYLSARGCQGFVEPQTPGSYLNISSIGSGSLGAVNTLPDFKLNFDKALQNSGWCILLFHGVDDDGGYSPIPSLELEKSLAYLSERTEQFWVTTFLNATLYAKERDAANVNEIAATATSVTLQVTDTLPNDIYNYPLTIRRPLPAGWSSATVTQKNNEVPVRIATENSISYIVFDVVPDGGEVRIMKLNNNI